MRTKMPKRRGSSSRPAAGPPALVGDVRVPRPGGGHSGHERFDIQRRTGTYSSLGYRSATAVAGDGLVATHASGAAHTEMSRTQMVAQSRMFKRDNAIFSGMIERSIGYIIENGYTLQALTDDPEWNKTAEGLWQPFWNRPEIKGLLDGPRVERMVCRELFTVGDVGSVKVSANDAYLLELIEGEQIVGTGAAADGIAKDPTGRPTRFFVGAYDRSGRVMTRGKNNQGYAPAEFIFITDPDRPSGVRGVPPCQSCFPMLHRINDVCDSEAIAWQMLARFAVSINRERAGEIGQNEATADTAASDTALAQYITELEYALIFHGEPGDEIKGIERNIPGKNFSESLLMFLRLLGLPLGLPLEVVLLDWTKSNYSQSRAVLEQAFKTFTGWQSLIENFFHREVYRWKIAQWVKEKKLPPRPDQFKHDWIKPAFPWLDQLKEAQAWGQKLDRGFATHTQACKSLNLERDVVIAARETEVRDAIERAKEIEKDTGVLPPWEIFCGLRPAGTNTGRPGGAAPAAPQTAEPDDTTDDGDDK